MDPAIYFIPSLIAALFSLFVFSSLNPDVVRFSSGVLPCSGFP